MNTNHNNESSNPEFDYLFTHGSEAEEMQSETRALNFRFLSELEKYSDKSKGMKKRLAALIGTSASYITQLFNGDKIINLETVAKFQKALGIKFKIKAYYEDEFDYISDSLECGMVKHIFVIEESKANSQSSGFIKIVKKEVSIYS